MAAEHMIATAGAIDTHVHWICPQLVTEAVRACPSESRNAPTI